MDAERRHLSLSEDTGGSRAAKLPFKTAELRVWKLLRLRTAARLAQSAELDSFVREFLGVESLSSVGGFAELGATAPGKQALFVVRTRPGEMLLVSLSEGRSPMPSGLSGIFERCAAATATRPLLSTIEDSDGVCAFRLWGTQARAILLRLADATSLPRTPGTATQLRLADLRVLIAWHSDSYTVLIPPPYRSFFVDWLRYAAEGVGLPPEEATSLA